MLDVFMQDEGVQNALYANDVYKRASAIIKKTYKAIGRTESQTTIVNSASTNVKLNLNGSGTC